MKPTRVLSLLPVLGQPRDSKRIAMLREEGFDVAVAAFSRAYHKGRMPEGNVTILGNLEHGRYILRAFKMIRAIPRLRRKIRDADVIYASGPDLGLFAQIAGLFLGRPVIVEIGDIRKAQVARGFIGAAVRMLDKVSAGRAALLVSTADGFVRDYYRKWLGVRTAAMVIENKLEPGLPQDNSQGMPSGDLTIGYFGVLRCQRSWQTLEAYAALRPDVRIVVAGIAIDPIDLAERVGRLPNASWLGQYRSPEDLQRLYSQVDMVWACYPFPSPGEQNWRWARTNRFYEACHFQKPMIVLAGSGDHEAVALHQLGLAIGAGNMADDVLALSRISRLDLENWHRNSQKLQRSVYTYLHEASELRVAIDQILASHQASTQRRQGLEGDQKMKQDIR
jgi:succinoglycan biosynthesis protein ExoL